MAQSRQERDKGLAKVAIVIDNKDGRQAQGSWDSSIRGRGSER
jgi:hypothetical protein